MPVQPALSAPAQSRLAALPGPIVVLGADGFVGSNLALCLNRWRNDIHAVVHRTPAGRLDGSFPAERIRAVDIRQESDVAALLETVAPAVVFDLVTHGGYSYQENVERIIDTNFTAKIRMVEGMLRRPLHAYVHAGSSSEYGLNCRAPSEDALLQPNSHYAVSKAGFAHYLAYAGKVRQFPCMNLRLYSVYGPLEEPSRLMPTLIRKALAGDFPPFVHPSISRDYVFVDDVCEAFVMAAHHMTPELYGDSFNIGTGVRTTMADLADMAQRLFSIPAAPQFGSMDSRKWDVSDWYADPAKAKSCLTWQARTTLSDGLVQMSDWVRAAAS